MPTDKSIDGEVRAELLALYQVTTQDLAFFKSQQWSLTNYGLLGLAAIAGIPQLSGLRVTPLGTTLLCAIAAAVAATTAWFLWRLHRSIEERRNRLDRVYAMLSSEFKAARGDKGSTSAWEMVSPLWLILAVALGLSLWVIICAV
jgi:hypothetical protein